MLTVGTRGSALALAQTELVLAALRQRWPDVETRVERITTTGDARRDVSLAVLGRGAFVSEIESALRDRRIDIAVHSAKDLPSRLAPGLRIGAVLERADARDVLVSRDGSTLRDLAHGARVGTGSPRRACQLRAARPDLDVQDIRGNVDTRLRKLAAGEYDALVLAAAGLIRLGRADEATEWLEPSIMLPAVAQGAIAVELRADDQDVVDTISAVNHQSSAAAVMAERAFLARLGAGCTAAVAAHAVETKEHDLSLTAMIGAPDGRHVRDTVIGPSAHAEEIGETLASALLESGGGAFLDLALR